MPWKDSETDTAVRPGQTFLREQTLLLGALRVPQNRQEENGGLGLPDFTFYLRGCVHEHAVFRFCFEERMPLCSKCLKTTDLLTLENKDSINGETRVIFMAGGGLNTRKGRRGGLLPFLE